MQSCIHCKSEIADDSKFCPVCGKEQASGCPNCKATIQPGQMYCAGCGANLTVPVSAPLMNKPAGGFLAFIKKPPVWISAVCVVGLAFVVSILFGIYKLGTTGDDMVDGRNTSSGYQTGSWDTDENYLWDEFDGSISGNGTGLGTTTNPAGNVKVAKYNFYAQTDPAFGIEAYRVLTPEGWNVQGNVQWNYASANAPAAYTMQATSADGNATVMILSDMHFATLTYSGGAQTEAAMYGAPQKSPAQPDVLAKEVLESLGLSNANFTGNKNMDSNKTMLNTYLMPEVNKMKSQLAGTSQSIQNPYLNLMLYTGTASMGGQSVEIKVVISTIGYQMVTSGYVTQTADIWQMGGCHVMVATQGQMAKYESDMAAIETNFIVNRNWLTGRNKMSEEIYAMLRNQQISDWRQANQMSAALSQRVDAILERTSNYSAASGGSSLSMQDKYEEFIFNENTYDMGNGEQVRVDTKYDYVWRGQNGDIIASDSPGYNPNIGGSQSYDQLPVIR